MKEFTPFLMAKSELLQVFSRAPTFKTGSYFMSWTSSRQICNF